MHTAMHLQLTAHLGLRCGRVQRQQLCSPCSHVLHLSIAAQYSSPKRFGAAALLDNAKLHSVPATEWYTQLARVKARSFTNKLRHPE